MPLTYSKTHWPDILGQTYSKTPVFNSVRTDLDGAGDQRTNINGPVYRFLLSWNALTPVNASHVLQACDYMAGGWGRMWFWEWKPELHTHTATATGNEQVYTLPALHGSVSGLTATVNGSNTVCTISSAPGANGEARAAFTSNPAAGAVLVFNFTGRHVRRVAIEQNDLRLTDRPGDAGVWQGSVTLVEVPN